METAEFEEFFRATYAMLTRYARRSVDPATAEELAAAALHAVWEKQLPAPTDDVEWRKLRSLACRIVEGKIRNELRTAGKRRQAQQAVVTARIEWALPECEPPVDVDESWPMWAESLSVTDREVLGLVVDGFKTAEIAAILECSPAAVTMRLQRAKARARNLWGEEVSSEQ